MADPTSWPPHKLAIVSGPINWPQQPQHQQPPGRSFALLVPPRGLYGLGPLIDDLEGAMEEIKVLINTTDTEETRSAALSQPPRG